MVSLTLTKKPPRTFTSVSGQQGHTSSSLVGTALLRNEQKRTPALTLGFYKYAEYGKVIRAILDWRLSRTRDVSQSLSSAVCSIPTLPHSEVRLI